MLKISKLFFLSFFKFHFISMLKWVWHYLRGNPIVAYFFFPLIYFSLFSSLYSMTFPSLNLFPIPSPPNGIKCKRKEENCLLQRTTIIPTPRSLVHLCDERKTGLLKRTKFRQQRQKGLNFCWVEIKTGYCKRQVLFLLFFFLISLLLFLFFPFFFLKKKEINLKKNRARKRKKKYSRELKSRYDAYSLP